MLFSGREVNVKIRNIIDLFLGYLMILRILEICLNVKSHHSPGETGGHGGNKKIFELGSSLECMFGTLLIYHPCDRKTHDGCIGVMAAQSMFVDCYRILNLQGCGTFPLF
jgi:hypothetical protein